MPLLFLALLLGVLAYLYWKRTATTLTRNCRWRQDRAAGDWVCTYCGARNPSQASPTSCENIDR
ncbi:hypothetical protein [Boseongicola aestuarii]|uniref:hypothetical protein n=1 Tax=Boseongicola aestuarii TaxID=1470561 RepID=UPI000BB454E0|nr:hypothetical protein [Boseongicola aestuarii]